MFRRMIFSLALGAAAIGLGPQALAKQSVTASTSFELQPNAVSRACLPDAQGEVTITPHGLNQQMRVRISNLPPNTVFTVFVLQVPHGPFGESWYQGDIQTDNRGVGQGRFIGIFSDETFIVAPGEARTQVEHPDGVFPDAEINEQSPPVHMFHLGIWFDAVADSVAAGCPATQTPFNGDHTAGIQVLNSSTSPDDDGPLAHVAP